jgi:hypothetical protein
VPALDLALRLWVAWGTTDDYTDLFHSGSAPNRSA